MQVVDRDGRPVAGLTPDRFEVSIGGKRREVVSADYIVDRPAGPAQDRAALAIDEFSFGAGESRGIAVATQRFIEQLAPTDYVGLLPFPSGPSGS